METRINDLIKPLKRQQQRQKANELLEGDGYLSTREAQALSKLKLRKELEPLKKQIERIFSVGALTLYRRLFEYDTAWNACITDQDSPESSIIHAARSYTLENIDNGIIAFEDAGPILYLSLMLGETMPDMTVKHLIVDEHRITAASDEEPGTLFPLPGLPFLEI